MCAEAKIGLMDRSFEATVLDDNCIFRGAFFARSSHTLCCIGTNQKDRVVTSTKAMRSLHQLTGAGHEVFALVLHDLSMDSYHSFSIMGNILFSTYMQNFMAHIETEKEAGPSKAKNTISR